MTSQHADLFVTRTDVQLIKSINKVKSKFAERKPAREYMNMGKHIVSHNHKMNVNVKVIEYKCTIVLVIFVFLIKELFGKLALPRKWKWIIPRPRLGWWQLYLQEHHMFHTSHSVSFQLLNLPNNPKQWHVQTLCSQSQNPHQFSNKTNHCVSIIWKSVSFWVCPSVIWSATDCVVDTERKTVTKKVPECLCSLRRRSPAMTLRNDWSISSVG